ncbi:DUF1707 SHOCT-like domain-containing protein [Prauserella muralis]|uniref:DUF1707 domain-containing protein n=1 Tax=Prauserella muralis TaxID=588067 RepID=A0A2V4AVX0_9PSEU|nr:DUF1707 domain-containing protein [Prauserella muralis]PXY25393.1 hypothetical protein BAY60_18630 [Prauserella muralis]TWE27508.1 uncharacterized protein DUF1707 [Prauserella muralis]
MDQPWIRASDADRDRVVATLRRHVGDGRLNLDEFSERAASAYRARTLNELNELTRDLPALDPPAPRAMAHRRVPMLTWVVVAVVLGAALLTASGIATATAMSDMMGGMCQ